MSFTSTPTGLTASDFTVTGVTGWSVSSVVGYGLGPYMVTVSPTGSETEGAMGLRLDAGSVTLGGAAAPAASVASTSTITIDLTPPSVSSFTTASQSPTNATSVAWTLTLSEATTGVVVGDFSNAGTATGCA